MIGKLTLTYLDQPVKDTYNKCYITLRTFKPFIFLSVTSIYINIIIN